MLGNSSRSLISIQKQHLYRCCILSIALYGFQLWYYNKAPLTYSLKELRKIQRSCISPSAGIEAIVGLTPIHLHLQKLSERFHLKAHSLLVNYIIKLILEVRLSDNIKPHLLSLNKLTPRQCTIIKSPIINRFNEIIPSFSLFNSEFSLGNRLVNVFPNQFSFYPVNRKSNNNIKSHLTKLNNLILLYYLTLNWSLLSLTWVS